jgi:hypothetical protein
MPRKGTSQVACLHRTNSPRRKGGSCGMGAGEPPPSAIRGGFCMAHVEEPAQSPRCASHAEALKGEAAALAGLESRCLR